MKKLNWTKLIYATLTVGLALLTMTPMNHQVNIFNWISLAGFIVTLFAPFIYYYVGRK